MKPAIQASNIRFCDMKSNAVTVKWDNGDGDRRIVVITPEKVVTDTSSTDPVGSTSSFGETGVCSTYENPDPLEQRHNWPAYRGVGSGCNCGCDGDCGCDSSNRNCKTNITYVAPEEALPLDGTMYKPNLAYGDGDELFITTRGLTSSDPSLCPPGPSPSPSPSPSGWELITPTTMKNGAFVVYEGTGNEVTVLNLEAETGYYVSVYEFNEECTEYLVEPNSRTIVTSCKKETGKVTVYVSDCRTCRELVAMVEIRDKCGKLRDIGSTDKCGKYVSRELEIGGYTLKVIAANYDEYTLNNIYIKPKPDPQRSDLHPNWTQGTRVLPVYSTPESQQRDNTYDVKL